MRFVRELLNKPFEEFHIFKENGEIRAAICIGSTALSKSFNFKGIHLYKTTIGGIRRLMYANWGAMLEDAWRLAYLGMVFKAAFVEELEVGGAKMAYRVKPGETKKDGCGLIEKAINKLAGKYLGAEDMGTIDKDLESFNTPYLVGLAAEDGTPGNPAPFTAGSVMRSLEAGLVFLKLASDPKDLSHLSFSVQGFGAVGSLIVANLVQRGVDAKKLYVSDKDNSKVSKAKDLYPDIKIADPYDPDHAGFVGPKMDIVQPVDVFMPAAKGAIFNSDTVPVVQFKMACGCANNQLATEEDARSLHERGKLYLPDFYVNNGGLIFVYTQLLNGGFNYDPERANQIIDKNYERGLELLDRAAAENRSPHFVATDIARSRVENARQEINRRKGKVSQLIKVYEM